MTKIQLILLLSIIIVILLLIDAFRRSKRKKYNREMAEIQALQEKVAKTTHKQQRVQKEHPKIDSNIKDVAQKVELGEDIKVDPHSDISVSKFEESQTPYPQLDKGIVSYYISAPRGYVFNGEDLDLLFKRNGLSFNADEHSFELLTQDKDVLFSIKADAPIEGFDPENFSQSNYTRLLCTCDIAELAQFYEPQTCFEHFTKSIEKINARLGGTLLNEHKCRFTSHDESAYKSQLKKFESK